MDSRVQIENFVRNVKARNRREIIACLIVLPIFVLIAVMIPVTVLRYAQLLLFLGVVVILMMLRLFAPLRGDLAQYPADNIPYWQGEMLRQARLLRLAPLWYLLPVIPGFILVLWFLHMIPGKSWIGHALFIGIVFGLVIWLNFRAARKLEKEARSLNNGEVSKLSESTQTLEPVKPFYSEPTSRSLKE